MESVDDNSVYSLLSIVAIANSGCRVMKKQKQQGIQTRPNLSNACPDTTDAASTNGPSPVRGNTGH